VIKSKAFSREKFVKPVSTVCIGYLRLKDHDSYLRSAGAFAFCSYFYLCQGGNVFAGFCLSVCLFVCVSAR